MDSGGPSRIGGSHHSLFPQLLRSQGQTYVLTGHLQGCLSISTSSTIARLPSEPPPPTWRGKRDFPTVGLGSGFMAVVALPPPRDSAHTALQAAVFLRLTVPKEQYTS